MGENQISENIAKKSTCSYKHIACCICLVIILAIFCVLELAILVGIFTIFIGFYIAIIIFGGIYALGFSLFKLSKHYKSKKSN